MGIVKKTIDIRIPLIKPLLSGNPKRTIVVLIDTSNHIMTDTMGVLWIMLKSDKAIIHIEQIQSILSTYPKLSLTILIERANSVITQAIRSGWIVNVMIECSIHPVKPLQTTTIGTDPQHAGMVFKDCQHLVIR